jgi:hypothetical protein
MWKYHSTLSGAHLLLAVEAEGEVQGLLALKTQLRESKLYKGKWVLYVDFVESAPWNQNVEDVQPPRFAGVGTLLIGEAIRTSMGKVTAGRLGLHALPQSEDFYAGKCGMTVIGRDRSYGDMLYFEHRDDVVVDWLSMKGLSA